MNRHQQISSFVDHWRNRFFFNWKHFIVCFKLYFICTLYDKYTKQHRIRLQFNHYTNGIQKKVKWLIWICISRVQITIIRVLWYRNCHLCRRIMVALYSCLAIGIVDGCWWLHGEWNVKSYFHVFVIGLYSSRTITFLSKILLDVCVSTNKYQIRF